MPIKEQKGPPANARQGLKDLWEALQKTIDIAEREGINLVGGVVDTQGPQELGASFCMVCCEQHAVQTVGYAIDALEVMFPGAVDRLDGPPAPALRIEVANSHKPPVVN